MTKKLTAKTQELNPKLPQFSNSFSKCLHIPPDTQEILLKKGTVYANFCIQGTSNFDTQLVIKVIEDVLHDSYYQSENISPVQSMEKAILEIKTKISQLSSDTLTSDPQSVEVNFISAVLWGKVIYIIRFGDMDSFVKILKTPNPKSVKSLGRKVKNFDGAVWDKYKKHIVKQAVMSKFLYNPEIKEKLLNTGDKYIAEDSPYDKIWGIGTKSVKHKQNRTWPGQNLLGEILMEVRSELRN